MPRLGKIKQILKEYSNGSFWDYKLKLPQIFVSVEWECGEITEELLDYGVKSAEILHLEHCNWSKNGIPILFICGLTSCRCATIRTHNSFDVKLFNEKRDMMRDLTKNANSDKLDNIYKQLSPNTKYIGIKERLSMSASYNG